MKVDLYVVGVCQNNGQPTQIAGGGVVLVFTDKHGRASFRSYKYALGNSTQNLADLQVARLALASIRSSHRGTSAVLHIGSNYVERMLEREGKAFVSKPSKNEKAVTEMRRWFLDYGDITVIIENPNDDNMLQAKDQADIALATQTHSDSGTSQSFDMGG